MWRATTIVLAIVFALAACGDDRADEATGAGAVADGALPFGLLRCDPDAPLPTADESLYRDEPVYVGNEQPVDAVRAWAEGQPGFEQIWVDRANRGWVSVGFSEGADERQAEIEELFPDDGVVAVPLDFTNDEMADLRERAQEAVAGNDVAVANSREVLGVVEVWVGVLDEAHLEPLSDLADEPICVTGVEPADAVADGPQPTAGDGWRLIGDEPVAPLDDESFGEGTDLASTDDQYAALWESSGMTGERPAVDLDATVVVRFATTHNSCTNRMDDVVVEGDVVRAEVVVPGAQQACNDIGLSRTFVVALDRDRLPAAPFVVRVGADGTNQGSTRIDVDLRPAGAAATNEQVVTVPADSGDGHEGLEPGGIIEPDFAQPTRLDLACELSTIGPFNDFAWQAEEDLSPPPAEWAAAANADGFVEVEVLLTIDPPQITATAGGRTVTYSPAPDADPTSCT